MAGFFVLNIPSRCLHGHLVNSRCCGLFVPRSARGVKGAVESNAAQQFSQPVPSTGFLYTESAPDNHFSPRSAKNNYRAHSRRKPAASPVCKNSHAPCHSTTPIIPPHCPGHWMVLYTQLRFHLGIYKAPASIHDYKAPSGMDHTGRQKHYISPSRRTTVEKRYSALFLTTKTAPSPTLKPSCTNCFVPVG